MHNKNLLISRAKITREMQFLYEETGQVSNEEILIEANNLEEYCLRLIKVAESDNYMYDESSINLPFDEKILERVYKLKEKLVTPRLKYIIDIGIGGSNLGTKAIYDALFGYFDTVEPYRYPKIIFADTNDPAMIAKLDKFLKTQIQDPSEFIVNAVSKSGKTTEALVNLEIIINSIDSVIDRLVITTDYNSELWKAARGMKVECLPIPNKVGGRYSGLSAVGLFPLACAGTDIAELVKGAMEARKVGLTKNVSRNASILSAAVLFLNYKKGKLINDNFFFHPELESLGKWYRQLMAESLGKEGKGITPTVSVGSADLHSVAQLYLGGIKDKVFTLVSTENGEKGLRIPHDPIIDFIDEIKDKTTKEIMDAILTGVKISFYKNNLPFTEIVLEDISARSIGQYMQFKMIEIMYLAQLMGVNAFDQPNVESYKKETRKILLGK